MDKQSPNRGGRSVSQLTSRLERALVAGISNGDLERNFLDLLGASIDDAGSLLPIMKRQLSSVDEALGALYRRLIGRYFEAKSDHRQAIKWTSAALHYYRSVAHAECEHQCLRILFTSYAHLGQYNQARDYAQQALGSDQLASRERAKIFVNLATLECRLHNYESAGELFDDALTLLSRNPDPKTQAIVYNNLGNLCVLQNQFAEAEQNFECARDIFHREGLAVYEAHNLQSFGNLYVILGQYFQAEQRLKESKAAYQRVGDEFGAAFCDIELFRMEIRMNRFERALDRLPSLVASFKAMGRTFEMGLLYYHGAHGALALREIAVAEDYLKRATQLFLKEDNRHYLALCGMLDGLLCWRSGRHKLAASKVREAMYIFNKANLRELELECIVALARIRGKPFDKTSYHRVRTLLKHPLSPPVRIQALIQISNYWFSHNQIKRSVRSLFEAVNTIEESRASIVSKRLRESFFEDKAQIYEVLIERLFQWRDPTASRLIFRTMELSRSRQMSEMLSRREALPPVLNRDDPSVLERNRLELRMSQLNRKMESLTTEMPDAELEKAAILDAMAATRREMERLKVKMGHQDRLGLFFPIALEVSRLRAFLEPGHLVVIYFLGDNALYRIELDRDGLQTYMEPLYKGFFKDLNFMVSILANRITSHTEHALRFAANISKIMVPTKTKGVRHYSFILHKDLQRFPLALLSRDGRYLLDDHTISQCPNLPTLYFSLQKPATRCEKPVFFFSDHPDDPRAQERHGLSKQFPDATLYRDFHGEGLNKHVSDSDFIHFAGHCLFNHRRPTKSYLLLAGARVRLAHFANMRFRNHPFINLATCQSGGVALSAGNEPYGFVITAFAAGAANILASCWEIDDAATAQWMDVFYAHLDKGLAEAYRQACLALKAAGANPYFWSGFCLLGRP